ncbi:HET-domain-containing protein [Hypoxylon sp. FL1857]|nr:HET-domain-containing protein [Hypoxylon sp. FL1857]
MRLIDVNTLELKEFFGHATPRYAILSHTWGDKEVTFQEWERRSDSAVRRKDGYAKIVGACRRAKADGLQYLWCDTNCIDKRSSAELSEAINSMFAWYRDSHVCYAYLADVQAKAGTFARSRWFTRGWTLQELLAPIRVVFFDYYWTILGDRSELASVISDITRIHIGTLQDRSTIHGYSIAQRMSWAAGRETTRSEDIAYCLLGIFSINMPLLYGEGSKAFIRLQQEIIKVSVDQTILAWDMQYSKTPPFVWTSALAPSPTEFRFCGSIVRDDEIQRTPYSVTNLGISMNLALIRTLAGRVLVGLNCAKELHREPSQSTLPGGTKLRRHFRIWIPLQHLKHDTYARVHHPSSKVFLRQSYPILERPLPIKLFLNLDESQSLGGPLFSSPIHVLQQNYPYLSSGVLITVSSGKMAPHGHIFKEVYPLGDISIFQFKSPDVSTVSHHLISSGDLSTIFSVYWDRHCSPREWAHTIIFDPKLETSSQMILQAVWNCIFDLNGHTQSVHQCNNPVAMHSLHKKLEETHRKSLTTCVKIEEYPMILVEDKPLKDGFGRSELIVNVIFRKPPG